MSLQIAIDGPVASGKGDIAARLAKKLNLVYIYTGAMYRMLALACIQNGIPFHDKTNVLRLLDSLSIELVQPQPKSIRTFRALLNGKDVTERIFEQDVAIGTSDVSVFEEVRKVMVARQQQMAQGKNVVMEGRDISYRVLPNAQLKIYLTASVKERAMRRWKQWQEKDIPKTLAETLADTVQRDTQDMTRSVDPLKKTSDAWELDTTEMTQEEVISAIIGELKRRKFL
jgi:cytidylate kinase